MGGHDTSGSCPPAKKKQVTSCFFLKEKLSPCHGWKETRRQDTSETLWLLGPFDLSAPVLWGKASLAIMQQIAAAAAAACGRCWTETKQNDTKWVVWSPLLYFFFLLGLLLLLLMMISAVSMESSLLCFFGLVCFFEPVFRPVVVVLWSD